MIRNYTPSGKVETPVQMRVILQDETHTPIHANPRRLSARQKEEVVRQIDGWLKDGIIRPGCSEYASPIVVVTKKDRSAHICIDYRRLNAVVAKDHLPLPITEDQLDKLCNAVVFTTLNLKNGFFHVNVAEESRKYLASVTLMRHFEFTKMPFGFCNSPAVLQRYIAYIFRVW